MAMLLVLKSREDGSSLLSWGRWLDGVDGPKSSEAEDENAAWERSGPADHAMCLLKTEFFNSLHGLLGNDTVCFLKDDKSFEQSAVQRFWSTAPALPLVFAAFAIETAYSLGVELLPSSPAKIVELDYEGNFVRGEVTSVAEFCL